MFKKSRISQALLIAFGGTVALGGFHSAAQAQRVEITGSAIKRISSETALPVTVLRIDDLAKAGVTNAEQAVAFISSNQSSTVTGSSVGASTGGAAFADLRGLGAERTLVLVNGKRVVVNPYLNAAVDLNSIPYGAVERIEVLNDGASAIYGSDAISGVINFITRKDYQGLSLTGSITEPTTKGGGQTYDLGASGGIGSLSEQGWNLFGSIAYTVQEALPAIDRAYAASAIIPSRGYDRSSGTTFPANYTQGQNISTNPSLPTCNPPTSNPVGGICRFDYVPFINIIPDQEQLSVLAKGSYAIDKANTLSLEFFQANNEVKSKISPTPVTGLTMPAANPFFPGGPGGTPANTDPAFNPANDITVGWRTASLDGRATTTESKTDRFLLEWQGNYMNWDYTVAALQSNATVKNSFTGGYVSRPGLQDGLNGANGAPFLNPFGAQSALGQDYLLSQQIIGQVQNSEGQLQGVLGQVSGEVYKLPAGPMTLALGIEYYKDKAEYINNFTLIRQAASSGLELAEDSSGSRHWTGFMAELNIPVLKDLEVNLAARYDDYSDFGGTFNPKASVRWTPIQDVLVRGSINTGFRAPTLYDVYAPNSITFTENSYDDPVLCPGGVVNSAAGGVAARDCNQQFQQQQGGNQNLQPETSTAWSVGLVFQPTKSSTLSIDYWNYVVDDSIGPTGENVIFDDPTKYASDYVRCSQLSPAEQAALAGTCGAGQSGDPLAYIVNTQKNLGTYKTSGLDFGAQWLSEATPYGRFSAGYVGTYILSYEYQLEAGGVYNDNLGVYFNGLPISQYRHTLNFGWQYEAFAVGLLNRFSLGYEDENTAVAPAFYNKVGSVNTWDLTATWTGVKNLSVTLGLLNMFNQEPPFSNQGAGFQVGYDYRNASPIGRAILLRGTYSF